MLLIFKGCHLDLAAIHLKLAKICTGRTLIQRRG